MAARIENVQISCGGRNAYGDEAGALAALYGELLGMERYEPGYMKIARPDGSLPEIGFEGDDGALEPRPRWLDPAHPQQVHLDIEVGDLDAGEAIALRHGATKRREFDDHRVFADCVGHPFCLYAGSAQTDVPGRIARIVFDCFSPRAVSSFYQELFDMPTRVEDTPERVVIASASDEPMLAFQHAVFTAARWPDPAYPAQVHLDLSFEDRDAGLVLLDRLGAIRLAEKELHAVYADPAASHPFCVSTPAPPEWRAEHWAKRPGAST